MTDIKTIKKKLGKKKLQYCVFFRIHNNTVYFTASDDMIDLIQCSDSIDIYQTMILIENYLLTKYDFIESVHFLNYNQVNIASTLFLTRQTNLNMY